MTEHLSMFDNHHAFTQLNNCLLLPELQYILRVAIAYNHSDEQDKFGLTVKQSVVCLTNVSMEGMAYSKATVLPAIISSVHFASVM